jgi:hypothetical protein
MTTPHVIASSSAHLTQAASANGIVGSHYRVGKKIGEGSFGVVFEGVCSLHCSLFFLYFAVDVWRQSGDMGSSQRGRFMRTSYLQFGWNSLFGDLVNVLVPVRQTFLMRMLSALGLSAQSYFMCLARHGQRSTVAPFANTRNLVFQAPKYLQASPLLSNLWVITRLQQLSQPLNIRSEHLGTQKVGCSSTQR